MGNLAPAGTPGDRAGTGDAPTDPFGLIPGSGDAPGDAPGLVPGTAPGGEGTVTLTDTGPEPLVGTVMFTATMPGGGGGRLSCVGGGLSCGDACSGNKLCVLIWSYAFCRLGRGLAAEALCVARGQQVSSKMTVLCLQGVSVCIKQQLCKPALH